MDEAEADAGLGGDVVAVKGARAARKGADASAGSRRSQVKA